VKHFVAIGRMSYHTWRMRLIPTLLVIAAAACLPLQAKAYDLEQALREQHVQYQEEAGHRVTQSDGMTLAQATESIRQRTGGQVLSAETRVQGGREVHHIKVLKDGKVKTYKVNGRQR
jgi:uncharacterized membrane protein YkoI